MTDPEEMTEKELRKEVEDYQTIFHNLRPFLILALDEYYVGDEEKELKSKLKDKGIEF